ncbi:Gar1/Naf1 RNA binding region-domain-containing protein [Leptodontidium sp. MPI-SDFR-AT-0119]|nr:Gar1/Naf1 RNA binding region-domain-containing protein [Leptodontidium sp. MPI-SDFR-AT-0119]
MNMENSAVYDSAKATTADNIAPDLPNTETKIVQDPPVNAEIEANAQDTPMENAVEIGVADRSASPPLTHALEALLGGLDSPVPTAGDVPAIPQDLDFETKIESSTPHTEIPGDSQMGSNVPTGEDTPMEDGAEVEGEHPEWEVDSSPIESSSDDSSSDDSSDDESEEGDNAYKLLSPEEQARILMEGDGGSDDEGGGKAKGAGGQLRTKNEVPDVIVPKPDVVITADMPITEVGNVEHIVENVLVIKARISGENRALESGSVLCLEDRSVIGVVAEILGPVQKPLYSVMFTNAAEITEAGLSLGTKVFYSEKHSTFVFTQALKAYKGSDASNLHDEEVGDEEMEFSDDEAEAEHKRRVKQKRIERRGGKMQNGGSGRGGHPLQQQQTPYNSSKPISYDDAEEDGPYRPLTRPAGFENSVGHGEAPQEGAYTGNYDRPNREQFRGRGRGGDRGRGDRGRGRGDRGRGRGGYQERRGSGHSLPPRPQGYSQPPSAYPPGQYQQPPQGGDFNQPLAPPPALPNFYMPPAAYSPQQPQLAWPQFPPQFQQAFQNGQNPWQPPPGSPGQVPPATGGAFINPAFLPGQWNNQNGQNGGGSESRPSWG